MKTELKKQTKWAQHNGGRRWTLALTTPVNPALLLWLTQNYEVARVAPLGETVALMVKATPKTVAVLMELPRPKWGGSQHECNQVRWD